jgi:hypothetical protein
MTCRPERNSGLFSFYSVQINAVRLSFSKLPRNLLP